MAGQKFASENPWIPDTLDISDVGRWRVEIDPYDGTGPVDVTFFRDVPVQILEYGSEEPFGDTVALLRFPQITAFDTLGANPSGAGAAADEDLSWLVDGANVDIQIVTGDAGTTQVLDNDGTWRANTQDEVVTVWEGFVAWYDDSSDEEGQSVGLQVTCLGALYQLDYYIRAPKHQPFDVNVGEFIRDQFKTATRPALRTAAPQIVGSPTFTTRETGAWQPVLTGYIAEQLARMVEADGTMWSVHLDRPRIPVVREKNLTSTHYTVDLGQPGMGWRLTRDPSQTPNVYYGEGTDTAGRQWRNADIDADGATTYDPLAFDTDVHGGSLDPAVIRREAYANFGPAYDLTDAVDLADRVLTRDSDPGWVGQIDLRTDPQEGSRWFTIARHNMLVRYFRGTGTTGQLMHVSRVTHRPHDLTSTYELDTNGRDARYVDAILNGLKDGQDVITRRLIGDRSSDTRRDEARPWDDDAGAGWIPTSAQGEDLDAPTVFQSCTANSWTIIPILATEKGTIRRAEFSLWESDGGGWQRLAKPFHVSVYDREVDTQDLPATGLGPGVWDRTPKGSTPAGWEDAQLRRWGVYGEAAGHWPGFESAGDPLTGVEIDESTWSYDHPDVHDDTDQSGETRLWVAIWVQDNAEFIGRLRPGVTTY